MYSIEDLKNIIAKKNKRITWLAIPCALLFVCIVVSFIFRIQWLTTAAAIVMGILIIFCLDMFILPLARYEKHLDHALNGRTRQITGRLKEFDETPAEKEKLFFYPLLLNINKMENEEDDRLFYLDATLEKPQWEIGQKLTFTYYDKRIIAWQAEEE